MNKKELLKKVKLFELKSKKHIHQLLAGAYHSLFKGKGIEFFDVKEYHFGDNIKDIDWNVTARTNTTYVKNYIEERELQIVIAVDLSGSQQFGSQTQFKQQLAIELAVLLAFSVQNNNDKAGILLFTDEIEKYIPPKKGRKHVLRLVRELIFYQPRQRKTDINLALSFLLRMIKKKAIIFFISDFISDHDYIGPITILSKKHDLVAIKISDPFEDEIPAVGHIRLWDSELEEEIVVNTNQSSFRTQYSRWQKQELNNLKTIFNRAKIDYLFLKTNVSYIAQLTHFFKKRAKRY